MKNKLTIVLVVVVALAAAGSLVWAKTGSSAWLGVYTQPLDQKLAKSLGLNADKGALVNEVVDTGKSLERATQFATHLASLSPAAVQVQQA